MNPTPRSYLFVPGDRPERFSKAVRSGAHVIVLDLEDAVGSNNKLQARDTVSDWLTNGHKAMVRINGIDTSWYEEDIAMVSQHKTASIMLPKADAYSARHTSEVLPGYQLIALLETVEAYINLTELMQVPHLYRVAFGSIDFSTESGILDSNEAMTAIRTQIALMSRFANLLPPIDGVSLELKDHSIITQDALRSRELGFGGKLCVHPFQVDPVNAAWQPTEDEKKWAKKILEALESNNGGVIAVDGQMVDKPVFERAKQILSSL